MGRHPLESDLGGFLGSPGGVEVAGPGNHLQLRPGDQPRQDLGVLRGKEPVLVPEAQPVGVRDDG